MLRHLALARESARDAAALRPGESGLEAIAESQLIGAAASYDPSCGRAFDDYARDALRRGLERHCREPDAQLRRRRCEEAAERARCDITEALVRQDRVRLLADFCGFPVQAVAGGLREAVSRDPALAPLPVSR
jgi:DNA-directed RNA polymerase specialized sigma subunit